MTKSKEGRHVAVFNGRQEFIDKVCVGLHDVGYVTSSAHLKTIQSGALDLVAFIALHKPELIVYDLPRPYESHWNFLRLLQETKSLRGVIWVLTTTDKKAVEAAEGASDIIEVIFGEPYGVGDVIDAVRKKLPAINEG
jgi:hypothetical protein